MDIVLQSFVVIGFKLKENIQQQVFGLKLL